MQNQGGYQAGYWISYRLGHQTGSYDLRLGVGHGKEVEIPAGAYDVRISGAANTFWAGQPWQHFLRDHLQIEFDHCFVNWGTTFHPGSGRC